MSYLVKVTIEVGKSNDFCCSKSMHRKIALTRCFCAPSVLKLDWFTQLLCHAGKLTDVI
jgi:hypothetical protein